VTFLKVSSTAMASSLGKTEAATKDNGPMKRKRAEESMSTRMKMSMKEISAMTFKTVSALLQRKTELFYNGKAN
jgi:hypothetical protein